MRQQDANRTREWLEQTAGQTLVAQASGYRGGDVQFYDSRQADVRQVARVDWRDLNALIAGEAIILFAGRRIYAKLFHAEIEKTGPIRLKRPLRLPSPEPKAIAESVERVRQVGEGIAKGMVGAMPHERASGAIAAMLEGFSEAQARGGDGEACAAAAVEAGGSYALERAGRGAAETAVTAMMERTVNGRLAPLKESGLPVRPVDRALFRLLVGIEEAIGAQGFEAKERAFGVLRAMEKAADEPAGHQGRKEPKPMTPPELCEAIASARKAIAAEIDSAAEVRPELAVVASMRP
jgi:intracellular multiplication protein IcmO